MVRCTKKVWGKNTTYIIDQHHNKLLFLLKLLKSLLLGAIHKLCRHLGGGGSANCLLEGFYCENAKIVYVVGGGVKISGKVST